MMILQTKLAPSRSEVSSSASTAAGSPDIQGAICEQQKQQHWTFTITILYLLVIPPATTREKVSHNFNFSFHDTKVFSVLLVLNVFAITFAISTDAILC